MKGNKFKEFVIGLVIAAIVIIGLLLSKNYNKVNDKDIVILFSNDIHCGVNENVGISSMMKYYKELDNKNVYKALVDAGDFSQGNEIGSSSKGELMYHVMDKLKYDFIVPGNHEFDYGMDKLLENSMILNGIMYCCNLIDLRTNETVYNPYKIMKFGNKKVGLIGVSTPETITDTKPIEYQNDKGEYIYGFMQGNEGKNFYDVIQKNINEVKDEGADYVILVAHCGESEEYSPYNVPNILKNIEGVDVIIDGHSHHVYNEVWKDKKGKEVFCAQTGTKMKTFGKLTISKDGKFNINLIDKVDGKDEETDKILKDIEDKLSSMLDVVIYKENKVYLEAYDKEGNKIVRVRETNLGDFITDALKYMGETDIGMLNGGGIRDNINVGDITYRDLMKVFPFNNQYVCIKMKGKDLLDALEFGSRFSPNANGGFYQVSGIEYTIDTTKPSKAVVDEEGCFIKIDGDYRVSDVKINGVPLDLEKEYTISANDYVGRSGGDGATMFKNAKIYKDDAVLDIDVLINYLEKCDISQYENPNGQGRINIIVE